MGAVLRIESDEVVRLAEELAALRKMSVADAVAEALRAELEQAQEGERRLARMEEIAADIRAHLNEPLTSASINELYGADGLPA